MKDLTLYRLKHKKTGLYFQPNRYAGNGNLSTKGKIYTRKPDVTWGHVMEVKFPYKSNSFYKLICEHWKIEFKPWQKVYIKTMTPDWEVEEL